MRGRPLGAGRDGARDFQGRRLALRAGRGWQCGTKSCARTWRARGGARADLRDGVLEVEYVAHEDGLGELRGVLRRVDGVDAPESLELRRRHLGARAEASGQRAQ